MALRTALTLALVTLWLAVFAAPQPSPLVIATPKGASAMEALAAKEVRRYLYLRTGRLVPIVVVTYSLPAKSSGAVIVVADKTRFISQMVATMGKPKVSLALGPQCYVLQTLKWQSTRVTLVAGGDPIGTLYGAYRLAEKLGVRFYLHGDVVPDARMPLKVPEVSERGKPLFDMRGIQPFHDFPEGPDWWNADNYKAIIGQLPKLRMNFIGLHTYPEPIAEPTVWIGPKDDFNPDGTVKESYASSYHNTLRGDWGYTPKKSGDFVFGARELFERDDYGADPMLGFCPKPSKPEDCDTVFNRTASLLRDAFQFAHQVGVKTCIGTETPLTIPASVKQRHPGITAREAYEGMFSRIMATVPIDTYWFWTNEGWTWSGTSEKDANDVVNDVNAAAAAAHAVHAPFSLATAGWVLGPQFDRAMFDRLLPKDIAFSCINRQVGWDPVEPGFARLKGRPKWAIPWFEDDPALTQPQLWVGRMRRDAADALKYGCTGLMGLHWRTRAISPNVAALAQAGWEQGSWAKPAITQTGAVGGNVASFPNSAVAGTDDPVLYQTVRYDLRAYQIAVPNGTYSVTLRFCEPAYSEAGKRMFDVSIQGKRVIERLDVFAKVGQNHAVDYPFDNVKVTGGRLEITFTPVVEYPCIAAISVEGPKTVRINCGGRAYKDYIADVGLTGQHLPSDDFYADWCLAQFGPSVAKPAADIFTEVDGKLPRPVDWIDGPGGLRMNGQPWEEVQKQYGFVDRLASLRPGVQGAGNLERFDYWMHTFQYLRAAAHTGCVWAKFNAAMEKVRAEKDPDAKAAVSRETALPLRRELVACVKDVHAELLQTVTTTGEMGTVMNWEEHTLPGLLDKPGAELAQALGSALPVDAMPSSTYEGPTRLFVRAVRTAVTSGEALTLSIVVLSRQEPHDAAIFWRPLGGTGFKRIELLHVARGVYAASLPGLSSDIEYYVEATAGGEVARFPASAPALNQTVVTMPARR